jgi:hypothetical protein
VLPDGVSRYSVGTGAIGGYSPADLAALYHYSRTSGGKRQTIGIVDWYDDPAATANLDTFDARYGFPAETTKTFRKVNQRGQASPLPAASPSGTYDSTGEISLDIETARAVCASCAILLVEANKPTDSDLAIAEDSAVRLGATEVSNSWGGPENPAENAKHYASFAKAFTHPGVVITASTGDSGWDSWDNANGGVAADNVANLPATLPSVVSVGGTTVIDSGTRHEYVWNENGPANIAGYKGYGPQGASGGGCSQVFTAPRWQRHVAGYAATGCGSKRLAADVSADADPLTGFDVYDSDDGLGWFTAGGTSLSSPLVASMWALAGGAHKMRYPALTLYGNEKTHPKKLHDVTSGGNAFCAAVTPATCVSDWSVYGPPNELGYGNDLDCSFKPHSAIVLKHDHQCVAAKGYDGPSGVGTPKGLTLFSRVGPAASITASGVRLGHSMTFSAIARDPFPGGRITRYSWNFGGGKHSSRKHPKHTYKTGETHRITLTLRDNYGITHVVHTNLIFAR